MSDTPVLLILSQVRASGRLDGDEARALRELAPRLVCCLCDGLSGHFGPVPPYRFQKLAEDGLLTSAAIERALS